MRGCFRELLAPLFAIACVRCPMQIRSFPRYYVHIILLSVIFTYIRLLLGSVCGKCRIVFHIFPSHYGPF